MTPRPLVAVFVTGAILSASIGSARGQEAAPAPPPEAAAPAQPQYPPQGYPQYPPTYQQYPVAPTPYPPPGMWPRYIKDWEEGQPIPYGYHPEKRARKGLVIPGAVVFGVAYLLSTLVASENHTTYDGTTDRYTALWIPVIGPFIQMGSSSNANGDSQMFFLDGVAQAGGLTMLVLGLAFPRTILVRNDFGTISLLPTPMRMGNDGSGLGLVGRF